MSRLSPEREAQLRAALNDPDVKEVGTIDVEAVEDLLGEVDYLRGQVEGETAYASELRRRLMALEPQKGGEEGGRTEWDHVGGAAVPSSE